MAWEFRRSLFDLQGALVVGIGASDTQIRSSRFTSLPTDYSTGSYLPLTISDDTGSEVVWVTGHSTAADGVTVSRGREGTTARAFDSTAIVRCTPTLRDVLSTVATRSALPSDAHYGMRVLILNEGQVVERTSAGWNDSAPLEDDPSRQHRWTQAGASLNANSITTAVGMGGTQNGTAGTLATMSAGVLKLNAVGAWAISMAMFASSGSSRNQGPTLTWPGGAFPGGDTKYNIGGVIGGAGSAGNGLTEVTPPTFYASASEIAVGISCQVFSTVAVTGAQYDVYAEYLGR